MLKGSDDDFAGVQCYLPTLSKRISTFIQLANDSSDNLNYGHDFVTKPRLFNQHRKLFKSCHSLIYPTVSRRNIGHSPAPRHRSGSGIMAENLAGGNVAIALLGKNHSHGAIPVVLIHLWTCIRCPFNPAVTLSFLIRREITSAASPTLRDSIGGIIGTWSAHLCLTGDFSAIQSRTNGRCSMVF
ncbi:MAG: hypothetical protein CM1200mP18_15000 [Gammaproteobacteria bacterium]|nr:MAG: hypothetical protein CM1200mP18_15000 [Gammaproteobacteria bacterium]